MCGIPRQFVGARVRHDQLRNVMTITSVEELDDSAPNLQTVTRDKKWVSVQQPSNT